uniref:Uncharacterized protein n=1 Tax=Zea mays TaxID=4577 RepID=C0HED6_MAIZE|nr:unknown [Zea mays]
MIAVCICSSILSSESHMLLFLRRSSFFIAFFSSLRFSFFRQLSSFSALSFMRVWRKSSSNARRSAARVWAAASLAALRSWLAARAASALASAFRCRSACNSCTS